MTRNEGIPLTGSLINATVLLLGWFGLSSGIYAILTDAPAEGIVWIVATVGLSALLLGGKSKAEGMNRRIPVMFWLFATLMLAVLGVTKFYALFVTNLVQLGELQTPELFQSASSAVYVVLLAVFFWQLFTTYRQSKKA